MPDTIEIRSILSNDTETLRRCAWLVTEYSWGKSFPLKAFDESQLAEHHVAAYAGGQVVGYANVNRHASPDDKDDGEMWLAQVVVSPEYRERGVLIGMYKDCLAYMKSKSGRILAGTDNPIMEHFFQSRNWRHFRDTLDEAGDPCHIFEYSRR